MGKGEFIPINNLWIPTSICRRTALKRARCGQSSAMAKQLGRSPMEKNGSFRRRAQRGVENSPPKTWFWPHLTGGNTGPFRKTAPIGNSPVHQGMKFV
jgi:hypothetical protein